MNKNEKMEELKNQMEELRDKMDVLTVEMVDSYNLIGADVDDLISEFADSNVDVYSYDLIKWFADTNKATEFVNEALYQGFTSDIMQALSAGQYLYYSDLINNDMELLEQYKELAEQLEELEESEE